MRRLVIAVVILLAAGVMLDAKPAVALDDCYVIRATADARNERTSRDRAKRRLQDYIARRLSSLAGKSISPITTNCIRTACESTAIVCAH